jgi:hypothetical protein
MPPAMLMFDATLFFHAFHYIFFRYFITSLYSAFIIVIMPLRLFSGWYFFWLRRHISLYFIFFWCHKIFFITLIAPYFLSCPMLSCRCHYAAL